MRPSGRLHTSLAEGSTCQLGTRARPSYPRRALVVANKGLSLLLVALLTLPQVARAAAAPRLGMSTQLLPATAGLAPADAATRARVKANLGRMPLYYVENRGQVDPRVLYYVKGATSSVYFTRTGVVFELTSRSESRPEGAGRLIPAAFSPRESEDSRRYAIRLDFEGASPEVKIAGRGRTAAVVSHFSGRPSEWRTGLPTYASVVYEELWPGIDLVYGSESGRPKYSFHVKPGADPNRIRLVYRGASSMRLTEAGRLELETPVGDFGEDRPYAYQEGRGETKTEVTAVFEPEDAATGEDEYRFGFRVGAYDRTRTLVLDPLVLAYCGYIGGSGYEDAAGIAVDTAGSAYLVGYTLSSPAQGFPVAGSLDPTFTGGTYDAFVAKINAAGTALVYCGYIGGSGADMAEAIAVDGSGNAYVTGSTDSTEAQGFPVVGGSWDTTYAGGTQEAFVAKIDAGGTTLLYCGYIGGGNEDWGKGIAVDGSGNAYVVGETDSRTTGPTSSRFPVSPSWPYLTFNGGTSDVFVAKIDAAGSSLAYCGYIGGLVEDYGRGIAVDASGNAYVAGYTTSTPAQGFPVSAGSWDSTFAGYSDAFLAKVNVAGTALVYCGYVGGAGIDDGIAVAIDGSGEAYLVGETSSTEAEGFPVTAGPDLTYNGSGIRDVYVAKVNAAGTAIVYCGYIGGSGLDEAYAIALDGSGNAYVVGSTDSTEAQGFPVKVGPSLTYSGGANDGFVAKIDPAGTALVYCGYIGGSGEDAAHGIAVDGSGNAYVTGYTDSTGAQGFPVTSGPYLTYNGGLKDAFVAKIGDVATAVELTSFSATASDSAVDLSWETGSELDNLGFHLYRATAESGPYARITYSLIPGLGTSPLGARYSWRDGGLANGASYFYKLEDVETTGRTKRHGPVEASPKAALAPPAGSGPEPPDSGPPGSEPREPPPSNPPAATPAGHVPYGDPTAVSLRVVERAGRSLTLELVTGGFYAEPLSDGTVKLSVPGFETLSEPGRPSLPVERTMVEALVGLGVRVESVQAEDVAVFSSLRPRDAGRPELLVGADGTPRAAERRTAHRPSRGAYPALSARVVSVGFQGEVKKALVELSPLRWDDGASQLLLARRLRVRLSFSGPEPLERGAGSRGQRAATPGRRRAPAGLIAHLATREAGLYALPFERVFAASAHGIAAAALRLSYQASRVAFFLSPDPARFSPGSTLYFLSEGARTNPYGNEAVYELSWEPAVHLVSSDEPRPSMAAAPAPPSGASLVEALATREYETNRYYLASLTAAADPWLWEYLRRGESKGVTLALSQLGPPTAGGRIEIALMGVSDYAAAPDHHVRAFLNGSPLGEVSWDGKTATSLVADVAAGVLREGDNSLELESVADTPAPDSVFYLDRVRLSHPRTLHAEAGRFEGTFARSGEASISGLSPGAVLVDTTAATPLLLTGGQFAPSGFSFHAEAGHRYLAVSREALLAPDVRPARASALRSKDNQADYVLIAPRAFLGEAEALLAHRRTQGLAVLGVAAEEVYAHFGHGEARPEAIRDFLAFAFHGWKAPAPRYVLLLGDASYDPKSFLGPSPGPLLPTPLVRSSLLFTASDPALASVNGEDSLPDVAIGRLPASTLDEARSLVAKVIAWESSGFSLDGDATLVSDNPDRGGDFEADAEEIAHGVLASRHPEHLSLARLGTNATREGVQGAFNRGVSLLSYIGHGATMLWASEQLLRPQDVEALSPQDQQPLVVAMNCLNGYFHMPLGNSLSEKLVKADGRGAIASFSSSGMSFDDPAHRYHKALLTEIASGHHSRLGDALLAAQAHYADTGADPELLALYHLLGDPGLEIRQGP